MDTDIDFVIQPYQFEPVDSSSDSDSSENDSSLTSNGSDVESSYVVGSDVWCNCSNCVDMPTVRESKCCMDFSACRDKLDHHTCITQHEGFQANCLNRYVLEVSFYEYLDEYGPIGDEDPVHELYRYIAYRRFVRWIWHRLGKGNRRVIPSCAVAKIRQQFPSEEYTGFKYPRDF